MPTSPPPSNHRWARTEPHEATGANGWVPSSHVRVGLEVLEQEREAVASLAGKLHERGLGEAFSAAVEAVLACSGHVVVCGVGKPWFIAQKLSATLASTGTASFPLHPNEAVHGDIGRVRAGDVVLLLSNSGESEEVVTLLPLLAQLGAKRVALTGSEHSSLGTQVDICLAYGRIDEACPLKLAPSASSTAMLALGDALALAVLQARGFTREDYARFHPAGALGRKLMKVSDLMRPLQRSAVLEPQATVRDAIVAITQMRSGAAMVVEPATGHLAGIFTDGDLRRLLAARPDVRDEPVATHMTRTPRTVAPGQLVGDALRIMREHRIDELPVVDDAGRLLGHLDVQDLLDIGLAL